MRNRRGVLVAGFSLVVVALAAVRAVPDTPDEVLRVAIPEPDSLDPTLVGAPEVLRSLQRPLVEFGKHAEVVSALAKSWRVSDDGKTLTFHLRDARYSNGDPIVAGDFVYSARRLVDPRSEAYYGYLMGDVVGGRALLDMAGAVPQPTDVEIDAALEGLGFEAPDNRTLVVHLQNSARYFLNVMALWPLVPLQEDWITSPGATEAGNFVSSGPFILDRWEHKNEIVLKPNPFWWGDVRTHLSEIRMTISDEAHAQVAYEAGELDMAITPTEDVLRIDADPEFDAQFHQTQRLGVNFYTFNNFQDPAVVSYEDPGPTANRNFRIALTEAIDKQTLIDTTWAGMGQVANSVVMPGVPGYQPDLDPYPYNLEAARRHMAMALEELGVTSASDLGELQLGFTTGFDNEPRVAFMAEAWRQAFGISVDLIGSDLGVFFTDRQAGKYDIAFGGWGADFPHARNQLDGVFTCGGGNNSWQYCNPAFDDLIAKAAVELDPKRELATYEEAQMLLMNDAPILPLRYELALYAVKPYVAGLTEDPAGSRLPGDYSFETIRILEH
jgi:oligopeptide transport system substrate-binding protein